MVKKTTPLVSPRPKARPKSVERKTAPDTSLRPKTRQDVQERTKMRDLEMSRGDVEFRADLDEILSNDPLARLGYDPGIIEYAGEGWKKYGTHRNVTKDVIGYGPDYGSSKGAIAHEFRHRGLDTISRLILENPDYFTDRFGPEIVSTAEKAVKRNIRGRNLNELYVEYFDNLDEEFIPGGSSKGSKKNLEHTLDETTPKNVREFQKRRETGALEGWQGDLYPRLRNINNLAKAAEDLLHHRGEPTKAEANYPGFFERIGKKLGFAEGGEVRSMKEQMSLFEYGGLADDGMDREPVTGNEIPPGSMASEVRDDIPAQLSEGEYVVPADVVRYFGVRFFEDLRNQAKSGMMEMEAGGRIGGEPVSEDGVPVEGDLTPEELAMLQEVLSQAPATGMAEGGAVSQPTFNPANYQLGYSGAGQRTPQAQTTSSSSGYENKWYINAAGERRVVMFLNGQPLAPIPEGFVEDTAENRQALAQKPEEDVVVETAGMSSNAGNEDLGFTPESTGEGLDAGSIQGALQGAQMGSTFGPIGAIAGAVIGAMTSEQQTAEDPEAQAQTSAATGGSSEGTNVSAMDVAMDAAGLKGSTTSSATPSTNQEQEVSGTPSVSSTGEAPSSEGTGADAGTDAGAGELGFGGEGINFAKGGLATKKTARRKPSATKKRTTRKGLGGKK